MTKRTDTLILGAYELTAYASWLREEKGVCKATDLRSTEQYAKEYLQYRLDKGCSSSGRVFKTISNAERIKNTEE